MIKLSDNKASLINLPVTINALDNIRFLIKKFSDGKIGPAYVLFDNITLPKGDNIQIDRDIMIDALRRQEKILMDYLYNLGINAEE